MRLFKSRTVIFGIAGMFESAINRTILTISASLIDYTALYIVQDYIVTYELVAAQLSTKAATNIAILIPFAAVPGQFAAAFLVKYTKRYKWVTVSGYALNLLGLGLAYKYINGHDHLGALVVSQLILGFGEGIINTMQLGMQAAVNQEGKTLTLNSDRHVHCLHIIRHGRSHCFVHRVTWSGQCLRWSRSRRRVDWYVTLIQSCSLCQTNILPSHPPSKTSPISPQ